MDDDYVEKRLFAGFWTALVSIVDGAYFNNILIFILFAILGIIAFWTFLITYDKYTKIFLLTLISIIYGTFIWVVYSFV